MTTYANPTRPLTTDEIAARQKVWLASQAGEPVTLNSFEVAALWSSIMQTGKELSWHRDADLREAAYDPWR